MRVSCRVGEPHSAVELEWELTGKSAAAPWLRLPCHCANAGGQLSRAAAAAELDSGLVLPEFPSHRTCR
eukprot:scaffold994_cov226-Prasinococcus_capsulatus_cf.AAC.26